MKVLVNPRTQKLWHHILEELARTKELKQAFLVRYVQ